MRETVFALDIGTRKVAGLLMKKDGEHYIIQNVVLKEQLPNAMQDGQIHDIPKVAQVIKQVAQEIAVCADAPITEAAVAAAGRSLKTQLGQATIKLVPNQEISAQDLNDLELSAVADALDKMNHYQVQTSIDTYLCVGYSIIQSYLDDQPIQNLVGHQGYSASVDVIATFLPRIVVDSLTTALRLAGLEMLSLTLEPIAAMNAIIPQSMRMLNLALVDVGAGTSDIAITAGGTVKAFGMIAQAGDLITKKIAEHYLLDFMEAERVKRMLNQKADVKCTDVLGNAVEIASQEVLELIRPTTAQLAAEIAEEILVLNDGSPKGVILIGGGSLTPGLEQEIAQQLELAPNLVRIRDRSSLSKVQGAEDYLGPQLITPICIGCNHLDQSAMSLQKITINGETVQFLRLFNATVGDALLNCSYNIEDLIKTNRQTLTLSVNQQSLTIPVSHSGQPRIYVNDQPAFLHTEIKGGDRIEIKTGDADSGTVTLKDAVDYLKLTKRLVINGKPVTAVPQIKVNNQIQPLTAVLSDGDHLVYQPIDTVAVALQAAGVAVQPNAIVVHVNNQPLKLQGPVRVQVNGEPGALEQAVKDGDRIEYQPQPDTRFILADIFRVYQPEQLDQVKQVKFWLNGQPAGYTDYIKDGDQIELKIDHKD
ncbi:MAG: pilus assembly protein PilM [Firmicutes bacterium]|jgi:cell division protein FtsA|nr:pilus assembly protein PilM [Bacillota bacterium]